MTAAMAFSCASIAQAQEASTTEVEEIVVTGSFISGRSAETTALPVDVISSEEIEKKGTPTVVEQVKALAVSSGVLGESNQFGAGSGAYGVATVNLRGLGSSRNLVLLNGKRLANNDLNTIPNSAIGRVEILKEGASTTYGSDAIAGVVNFITRRPFTGVEVGANYRYIDGSDGGDYGATVLAGYAADSANMLFSFGYAHRSDLPVTARDWAVRPYAANPQGGWTAATNPSRFIAVDSAFNNLNGVTATGAPRAYADPGCAALGGTVVSGVCRQQYLTWDNIVDEEDRYQAYAEFNADITENLRFHAEAMYSMTDVSGVNTSPSFATSRGPSVTALPGGFGAAGPLAPGYNLTQGGANNPDVSNYFYVPLANPGFDAFCAANPAGCPTGTDGALFAVGTYRAFLAGGNPLFRGGAPGIENVREQTRISGGFKGTVGTFPVLGALDFTADLTYSQYDNRRDEYDTVGNRLQLAMRGLGGANCDYVNGTPGQDGCLWFNPFSNAIESNYLTGQANPGYDATVANNRDLISWFYQRADQARSSERLFEGNLIFNGQSNFELPGGAIGYAFGAQWRKEGLISNPVAQSSRQVNGCVDSMTPALSQGGNCYPQNGPFVFLGQINEYDISRNIYAAFAEVQLPLLDNLDLNIAGRFEDYGDYGGDTKNPKVSLRWQAFEPLAFRASYSTTFRAPPQTSLIPNTGIGLRNVFDSFRGVATTGNPNLVPEEAETKTVGAILRVGGLKASLDYYHIELDKVLGSQSLQEILNAVFPNGSTGPDNCGSVDPAFLATHFNFNGACSAANITQVNLLQINRGTIETDGFDLLVDYSVPGQYWGTEFSVGGTASYVNSYKVNDVDVAGLANAFGSGLASTSLPRVKGEVFTEATRGNHNLRMTLRHAGSYVDDRAAIFTVASPHGRKIKAQNQLDLAYRVLLPQETTVSVQVQNVLDKDPPFARTELSYDPLIGNPLGRTFQINVKKAF